SNCANFCSNLDSPSFSRFAVCNSCCLTTFVPACPTIFTITESPPSVLLSMTVNRMLLRASEKFGTERHRSTPPRWHRYSPLQRGRRRRKRQGGCSSVRCVFSSVSVPPKPQKPPDCKEYRHQQ